ncbi:MAG: DUF3857 domain-containing protein [Bacteroidota bacterium]
MRFSFLCFCLAISTLTTAQIRQSVVTAQALGAHEVLDLRGEIELVSPSVARYTYTMEAIILGPESNEHIVRVAYDPDSKIESLEAAITDLSTGKTTKLKKGDFEDVARIDGVSIYDDSRVKYAVLNHSRYPYHVRFSYTQRIAGIGRAVLPNWPFQPTGSAYVRRSELRVVAAAGQDVRYQVYNCEASPEMTVDGGTKTYTWAMTNIPPVKNEPWDPDFIHKMPLLRVVPEQFEVEKYAGQMDTWGNYGHFLHQLWQGRTELPAALAQQVKTLTADAADEEEKIARLYKFMQDNKRYVSVQLGIGGWQPFDANYVEERGYGDCKALSNYMRAMLAEIDITSYPVIVSAGDDQPYIVEDDFVDPAFNHAILYVPETDTWLECTSANNPPGYLGRFTNNRRVLLVTPEGGQLTRTPHLSVADNVTEEKVNITLAAEGGAALTYEGQFQGISHEAWRNRKTYRSAQDIEEAVRKLGKLPNLTIDEVNLTAAADAPRSSLTFAAQADRYAARAGKRLFVPLNLICPLEKVPDAAETRTFPVVVNYGYTKNTTARFQLPAGYTVESLPKSVELDTPYGQYQLTVEETAEQVVLQRSFRFYDQEYPPEEYAAFRDFLAQVAKADGAKMVLVRE